MDSARVIIEVRAGVIPEQPEDNLTKRWAVTSAEWEAAGDEAMELLAQRNGAAQGYAMLLMLQPNRLNWVRTDWLWL